MNVWKTSLNAMMSELNALTPSAVTHVLVGVASLAMELSVQVSLL